MEAKKPTPRTLETTKLNLNASWLFVNCLASRSRIFHSFVCLLICLFVCFCLGFIVPLENFSLIWRGHHCRWRAANFDCTHGHCNCAVRVLLCATSNVTRTYPLKWSSPRTRYRAFGSGASCFSSVATGDRNPISRMRGERSTSTLPRR